MVFGKLFGGGGWESHRDRAEELYQSGDLGSAKLAFDRALTKAPNDEAKAALRLRIGECLDGLAEQRMAEAERLREEGAYELARQELLAAIEVADNASVEAEAEAQLERLEQRDAVEHAAPIEEIDDAQLFEHIAARWEEEQAEELAEYGESLRKGLVALQKGEGEEALSCLEATLEGAEIPRYLHLELARAHLLLEDGEKAKESFESFLETLDDDEGGEARLTAHIGLARLFADADDDEGAMDQFQEAITALEDDYRPLLAMGSFLRSKDRHEEAVEVLREAAATMDDMRPDHWVLEELALALKGAGRNEEALHTFENIISIHTSRRLTDFPVRTTLSLATMYEEAGNLERAADLMATLARGSHREGHAFYHRETGRLLLEIGLHDEARRMLQRASALSRDDEEALAKIGELMAKANAGDEEG